MSKLAKRALSLAGDRGCRTLWASLGLAVLLSTFEGCKVDPSRPLSRDPKDFPFQIVLEDSSPKEEIRFVYFDLDGDGVDERIDVGNFTGATKPYITGIRGDGRSLEQVNFPEAVSITVSFAYDFNNDKDKDLVVLEETADTVYASIVDIYHSRFSELEARIPLIWKADTGLRRADGVDVTLLRVIKSRDRERLLVCRIATSGSRQPRAIAAYDLHTASLAWQYRMAPYPTTIVFEDLDDDGFVEIIVGSDATGNGIRVGNTDDDTSLLYILTASGDEFIKPIPMGGRHSETSAFPLVRREGIEIACFSRGSSQEKEQSVIAFFDPLTGKRFGNPIPVEGKLVSFDEFGSSLPVIPHPREDFILAATSGGDVMLFDETMKRSVTRSFGVEVKQIKYIGDVTGDDRPEIVLDLEHSRTLILSETLDPIALLPGIWAGIRRASGGSKSVVLETSHKTFVGRLEYRHSLWISKALGVVGILLVVTLAFLLIDRARFYQTLFRRFVAGDQRHGIMVLGRRGSILHMNKQMVRMLNVSVVLSGRRDWQSFFSGESYCLIQDFIEETVRSKGEQDQRIEMVIQGNPVSLVARSQALMVGRWVRGWLVVFEDVSSILRSDRMLNWALVAQNLAHEMKTPLSTIWFTLERLRQLREGAREPFANEEYLKSIEQEIRRLDAYVKGFMKLANLNPPNLHLSGLNDAIEATLCGYAEKLPKTITLQRDYAINLPDVRIDVNLFTVALINLLDNAVNAMNGEGTLKISTYLAQKLEKLWVYISIADTGCGIAPEDVPKIFSPYFTKSNGGTGLGLVITKKIVEDHGGGIQFTTKPGFGTEFVIQLPAGHFP